MMINDLSDSSGVMIRISITLPPVIAGDSHYR